VGAVVEGHLGHVDSDSVRDVGGMLGQDLVRGAAGHLRSEGLWWAPRLYNERVGHVSTSALGRLCRPMTSSGFYVGVAEAQRRRYDDDDDECDSLKTWCTLPERPAMPDIKSSIFLDWRFSLALSAVGIAYIACLDVLSTVGFAQPNSTSISAFIETPSTVLPSWFFFIFSGVVPHPSGFGRQARPGRWRWRRPRA